MFQMKDINTSVISEIKNLQLQMSHHCKQIVTITVVPFLKGCIRWRLL